MVGVILWNAGNHSQWSLQLPRDCIAGGKGVIPHEGIYSTEMFASVQKFVFPKAVGASRWEWAGRGVCLYKHSAVPPL